jgi:hypothetical protein
MERIIYGGLLVFNLVLIVVNHADEDGCFFFSVRNEFRDCGIFRLSFGFNLREVWARADNSFKYLQFFSPCRDVSKNCMSSGDYTNYALFFL